MISTSWDKGCEIMPHAPNPVCWAKNCELRIVFTYLNNGEKSKEEYVKLKFQCPKQNSWIPPKVFLTVFPDLVNDNFILPVTRDITLAFAIDSYHMVTSHIQWASKPIMLGLSSKHIGNLTTSYHLYYYHTGPCHH